MSLCGSYYSIFEKTTNNMIGYVAITFHELWQEEIEFYIYKDFRRKGYAYEACSEYIQKMKQDPFYRLAVNVENASTEETEEILDEINGLTDDDLQISTVRKFTAE